MELVNSYQDELAKLKEEIAAARDAEVGVPEFDSIVCRSFQDTDSIQYSDVFCVLSTISRKFFERHLDFESNV